MLDQSLSRLCWRYCDRFALIMSEPPKRAVSQVPCAGRVIQKIWNERRDIFQNARPPELQLGRSSARILELR